MCWWNKSNSILYWLKWQFLSSCVGVCVFHKLKYENLNNITTLFPRRKFLLDLSLCCLGLNDAVSCNLIKPYLAAANICFASKKSSQISPQTLLKVQRGSQPEHLIECVFPCDTQCWWLDRQTYQKCVSTFPLYFAAICYHSLFEFQYILSLEIFQGGDRSQRHYATHLMLCLCLFIFSAQVCLTAHTHTHTQILFYSI